MGESMIPTNDRPRLAGELTLGPWGAYRLRVTKQVIREHAILCAILLRDY